MRDTSGNEARLHWLNASVLLSTPVLAAVLVPFYWIDIGFTWLDWTWFGILMFCTGIAITGGYHRLWSHRAYQAHVAVRLFFAYWGACAGQNSIYNWVSDHRYHHRYVDNEEKDPYSGQKGFWWSHMGWMMFKRPPRDLSNVKDLEKDAVVMWQHRHYPWLILFSNLAVPIGLGFVSHAATGMGSPWGTLILAGLLRFVLNHHFTFFINSACHFLGTQPYSSKDTSRDNFLLALVTYGEGYHNYHHTFQADYRNGVRWYDFDPTKWLVKGLSYVGLTSSLRRVCDSRIMRQKLLHSVGQSKQEFYEKWNVVTGSAIYQRIERSWGDFTRSVNEWREASQQYIRLRNDRRAPRDELLRLRTRRQELQEIIEAKKARLLDYFESDPMDSLRV